MKKHKKLIALITIFFVSVAMFSVCPTSIATTITENTDDTEVVTPVTNDNAVTATAAYSETYTYATIRDSVANVFAAPVWTADVVDTLSNGHAFNIIYRELRIFYKTITERFSSADIANVWRNVLTHELGHAMGLDDLDEEQREFPSVPYSVMSYGRDRTSLAVPHNCDVAGVKTNYMNGGN